MTSNPLSRRACIPCKGEIPPLSPDAMETLQKQLGNGWNVVAGHHLEKEFTFRNFVDALAFVNRVGAIAEEQQHHPDITLGWGRAVVQIWTHKIDGLTESDFIFAAKTDTAV